MFWYDLLNLYLHNILVDTKGKALFCLANKNVLVTGASQGIGEVISRKFHNEGAKVALNYFPDNRGENRLRAESIIDSLGSKAACFGADVRDYQAVTKMFSEVQENFGQVDILVNNAGILRDRTVKKMSVEEWQSVLDTNLTGAFNTCKAASVSLSDNGAIINISSLSAVIGFFGQANYAAAKAGLIGLTKVISKELGARNIRSNAVAPGVVLTEMGKSIPEDGRKAMIKQIPLGRFGTADEIANTVLFLASPLASYITGQTLHVNGGWWG